MFRKLFSSHLRGFARAAFGFGARLGYPLQRVFGWHESGVVGWREINEPAVADRGGGERHDGTGISANGLA